MTLCCNSRFYGGFVVTIEEFTFPLRVFKQALHKKCIIIQFVLPAHKDFKQAAAAPRDRETHGGEDVPIFARGPMSHLFHGVHEQHYIAHVMAYASCVGKNKDHCENISSGSKSLLLTSRPVYTLTVAFSTMAFLNTIYHICVWF